MGGQRRLRTTRVARRYWNASSSDEHLHVKAPKVKNRFRVKEALEAKGRQIATRHARFKAVNTA